MREEKYQGAPEGVKGIYAPKRGQGGKEEKKDSYLMEKKGGAGSRLYNSSGGKWKQRILGVYSKEDCS